MCAMDTDSGPPQGWRGSWNRPAPEGVQGKRGWWPSWPQLPAHLIPPLLEVPLWDGIFHVESDTGVGRLRRAWQVWAPFEPLMLAGSGTWSKSLLPLSLGFPEAGAMRAISSKHLGPGDAHTLGARIRSPTCHPKPHSARPCAGQRGKDSNRSPCPQGVQNTEG